MPSILRPASFWPAIQDRKSTRLNSSHSQISYAVFCLKKKKQYFGGRSSNFVTFCNRLILRAGGGDVSVVSHFAARPSSQLQLGCGSTIEQCSESSSA